MLIQLACTFLNTYDHFIDNLCCSVIVRSSDDDILPPPMILYDRTTSEMRVLCPNIISRDSRQSENA
jgi:hypothetical protein